MTIYLIGSFVSLILFCLLEWINASSKIEIRMKEVQVALITFVLSWLGTILLLVCLGIVWHDKNKDKVLFTVKKKDEPDRRS